MAQKKKKRITSVHRGSDGGPHLEVDEMGQRGAATIQGRPAGNVGRFGTMRAETATGDSEYNP